LGRREDVLNAYRGSLQLAGDAARGKSVFQKNCSGCHRLEGVGHEIGPKLAAIKTRGAEAILFNMLDPNREVNPQYVNYSVLTKDGRSLAGMIASESAGSIILRRAENATDTVARSEIEELRSTGQSMMPEGLEKQIDSQSMADLISYLLGVDESVAVGPASP
jgi:putative heme-binding domain-containing protein